MLEANFRVRIAPRPLSRLIAVAVPPQIQAGARADLQDAQGKARTVGDLEKSTEERGAASDLVGLAASRQQASDPFALVDQRLPKHGPGGGRIAVAPSRGIVAGQPGDLGGQPESGPG